jgi:hypothetical protein
MNTFQLSYEARLRHWNELRAELENLELAEKCIKVDAFWQQCPLNNHYLHPVDITDWPNPWELIYENEYCVYARALGMVYTLTLLGINAIDLVDAKDDNNEDVVLVLVDRAKYVLNYWPNTVVNNNLANFKIIKTFDITPLITKIGKL